MMVLGPTLWGRAYTLLLRTGRPPSWVRAGLGRSLPLCARVISDRHPSGGRAENKIEPMDYRLYNGFYF
jgi:hypothetical protein